MKKHQKLQVIRESGIIAILRASSSHRLVDATEAVREGGVRALEVTMNTPGALDVISIARERFGELVLFGAGSVLDGETAGYHYSPEQTSSCHLHSTWT